MWTRKVAVEDNISINFCMSWTAETMMALLSLHSVALLSIHSMAPLSIHSMALLSIHSDK